MRASVLTVDYVDQQTKHETHLPITAFKKPSTDKEYAKLEKLLDYLIDEVRNDEKHPLAIAMQIIGDNLESYDNEHHPAIGSEVNDIDMIKYLMKCNNLNQKDLADIFGGQGNVSKFLNGERSLSKNQISGLKKYFNLSADFFIR